MQHRSQKPPKPSNDKPISAKRPKNHIHEIENKKQTKNKPREATKFEQKIRAFTSRRERSSSKEEEGSTSLFPA